MQKHDGTSSDTTLAKVRRIVLEAGAEKWPDAPMPLHAQFVSREHLSEQGAHGVSEDTERFMYRTITGTYQGVGSGPVAEDDLTNGVAQYAFSIGE